MHRLRWLLLLVLVAFGGCTCGTHGGSYDGSIPDYAFPDYAFPDYGLATTLPPDARPVASGETWFTSCDSSTLVPDEALVDAATDAFASLADGTMELPLHYASGSTEPCLRFVRVMSGGRLQSADVIWFTGESAFAYTSDGIVFGAYFVSLAHWERGGDGALEGSFEDDGDPSDRDGFPEVHTTERDGGYYQVVRSNTSTHEVEWRMTIEPGTPPIETTEQLVAGALTVVDRTTLDAANMAGPTSIDDCLAARHPCDAATEASLDASLKRALSRGTTCMSAAMSANESTSWDGLQLLKNTWSQSHTWTCMPPSCTIAHWDGNNTIDVGEALTTTYVAREDRTLFHELMHGVLGGHLDAVVNSEIDSPADRRHALMRKYADPVDSCESYCFDTTPTRCACATCLNTKACDPRCESLASCTEYDCTSGSGGCVAISSEAVGAACITTMPDGMEAATWFPTMSDCMMSDCTTRAASPGNCRSFSRSCEPGCE